MNPDLAWEIPQLVYGQHERGEDLSKKPYYDGKDTYLKEQPYCFACFQEDNVSSLKRCARCHVSWYCSTQCQKKHLRHHRELCRRIAEQKEIVEQEAIPLRKLIVPWEDDNHAEPENIFETRAGDFGGFDETQMYLEVRSNLANAYWDAAYESEVKQVWEKCLFHYLELLRLDASYRCAVRFRVPCILLYLNRDDDAFAFIRYWLNFDDLVYDDVVARHGRSKEGDWMYPRETNCRYLDIFKECPGIDKQYLTAPYLMALAIIKARIVAAHDAITQSVELALEQGSSQRIQQVQPAVIEMMSGSNEDMASQRQQLTRLLDRIHRDMPSMLPAFFENQQFAGMNLSLAETLDFDNPYPVDMMLVNGLRCFARVPGAFEELSYYE